jgi:tRNA(Arg) A34 adenosine deaminase TadA
VGTPWAIEQALDAAIAAARRVTDEGAGHPYGAALVADGEVVAVEGNRVRGLHDPTAHAEVQVIRALAAARRSTDLSDCILVTTAEPCPMCCGALRWAGIRRLVVGAPDPRNGGLTALLERVDDLVVERVDSPACRALLREAHAV